MPWVWESVPRYRLTKEIVKDYLREKWGDRDYKVTVCLT